MLQALTTITIGFMGHVPLPRLTQQKAEVADVAAAALLQKRLAEADTMNIKPEEKGGLAALYSLMSVLVAKYGAEVVSATAKDLENEQTELIDDYVNMLLEGLSDGMGEDD